MAAVGHDVLFSACFHHIGDKGMAETVASDSAIVEICQLRRFSVTP
jgi:hypothetical protein